MPIPDKKDIRRFCELDDWEETNANSPDHKRYRKRLEDGSILRTKVSNGRGPIVRNPGLWSNMWRHQLGLKFEQEFWDALANSAPAPRGEPASVRPEPQMESWLFEGLVQTYGVAEDKVLALQAEEALELYLTLCEGGGSPA